MDRRRGSGVITPLRKSNPAPVRFLGQNRASSMSPIPLSAAAAAAACGLSPSYLARLRQDGDKRRPGLPAGPRFRRVGRKVLYLREDLDAWLSGLPSVTAAPRRGRPTKAAIIARRQQSREG